MSMELKGKMKVCMSEDEMFLQWGELRKGEHSYQAPTMLGICVHVFGGATAGYY